MKRQKTNQELKFATKNRETILPNKTARAVNDLVAIAIFALSVVVAGMLFTYSSKDPTWFTSYSNLDSVHNKFGVFGALIADGILSIFGFSGWLIAICLFYLGFRKITRNFITVGNWYSTFQVISFFILLPSASTFENVFFINDTSNYLHKGYGGILGKNLFLILSQHFGNMQATIVILLLLVISFSITFSVSLLIIAEKLGYGIEFLAIKIKNKIKGSDASSKISDAIATKFTRTNSENLAPAVDDYSSMLDENVSTKTNFDFNAQQIADPFNPHSMRHVNKASVAKNEDELNLGINQPIKLQTNLAKIKLQSAELGFLPNTNLLEEPMVQTDTVSNETIEYYSNQIENKLAEFGVEAKVVNAESGPVITRYEILPSRGVRGDKIVGLGKEIARGLALINVRIVETIPGKNSMGIEVPNFKRKTIFLKEVFDSEVYQKNNSKLTLALGKDIAGNVIITDLAKMPHLLVAGTTGSGKSVAINTMILSILFQATADEVKFIMIDPKMVELSFYQDIPHLLAPVVIDMNQAANALKWTVGEMERRYKTMAKIGSKNIDGYNQKIVAAENDGNPILDPFNSSADDEETLKKWPYIVVIIDELADLMMVCGKKIEQYIARIAQKARAVGIHLIVATQRPSVDVITGLIKANIPARISFQVSSKIDSRTILDQMGAETLLGQGDMLFLQPGTGFPQRIHGAFVNDDELNRVVSYLKASAQPQYIDEILEGVTDGNELPGFEDENKANDSEQDPMFDEAWQFFYESKRCSISSLQTRFGIGYNRAARIMEGLVQSGMVRRNDRGSFEIIKNSTNN
jgi:S-DNA-T family DNA segregation ATPase FtsK/SpoIIIE